MELKIELLLEQSFKIGKYLFFVKKRIMRGESSLVKSSSQDTHNVKLMRCVKAATAGEWTWPSFAAPGKFWLPRP